MGLDDAIAALDAGEVKQPTIKVPDLGTRALPDEFVERIVNPPLPPPPPWLPELADLVVERLKPVVCAEVRAAVRAEARKRETTT